MNDRLPGSLCPIVIDSPNQQDQDDPNRENVYNFIKEFQPPDSQESSPWLTKKAWISAAMSSNSRLKTASLPPRIPGAHSGYFSRLLAKIQ